MRYRTFLLAGSIALLSTPAVAQKAGKPKPKPKACGIAAIPLQVGNQWVYEPVLYPLKDKEGNSVVPSEDQMKLLPRQPQKVTITVTDVQVGKDSSTVLLDEDVDGRIVKTTLTCTEKSLTASPESFWFAGEPGGAWNITLDGVERPGSTFPIANGLISSNEWHDDFKANWKRVATEGTEADLGSGTIKLDRRFVVTQDEAVVVKANNFAGVHLVGLETHGEITVAGQDAKPTLLPEGLVTFFWISDGTGPVQIANSFYHAYQLSAVTLGK
jgi:hypothetical protein